MMAFNTLKAYETIRPMFTVENPTEKLLPSPPQELFEIDASKTIVIVTRKGSRLTFPAFGWRMPDGRMVSDEVKLTIIELTTPAEIIAAGLGTTTQDRLLEMPAILHISAFSRKTQLKLVIPVEWELPLEQYKHINPLSQHLYRTTSPSLMVCGTKSLYDWQLAEAPKSKFSVLYKKQHLHFQLSDTGWWGLGAPVKCRHTRNMVSIKTPGQIPLREQKTYIVFNLNNAIIRMYEGAHHFTAFHVPACHDATVVSFGCTEQRLYGGIVRLDAKASIANLQMQAIGFEELILFRT